MPVKNIKILLLTAVPVIILDQLAKAVIMRLFYPGEVVEVIPGLFNVVFFKNPGAAFSIFHAGGAIRTLLLIGISTAALVIIWFYLKQSKDSLMSFALSLIAGGAIGNLIDRVRFGWVVDFLDLYIKDYHWPAFNVADSAITIGVGLAVLVHYLRQKEDK